jgi:hypothetical protein
MMRMRPICARRPDAATPSDLTKSKSMTKPLRSKLKCRALPH